MIHIFRALLCLVLVGSLVVHAEEKTHEQITAETRAFMERYFEVHQANDFTIDEFIKFYHDDLRATYYTRGVFTFTSAQQYYDTFNTDNAQGFEFDFDYKPWTESLLLLVDGENAVTRYVAHARTKRGEYHNHYIHMYTIRDGKIVEFHATTNPQSGSHYERNKQFLLDIGLYKEGGRGQ